MMALPQRRRRVALPATEHWRKSDSIQEWYSRQLRHVAREVGRIVSGFPSGEVSSLPAIQSALQRYSDLLEPWANATAERLFRRVDEQDRRMWASTARMMGRQLRKEIEGAPTGQAQSDFMQSQVHLIKSLPIQASERVHKLILEGQMDSVRAPEIAAQILETGQVTASRATLIARTEIARAASSLTMVRAQHVGSEGYIWETSRDQDVRESHRKMQRRFVRWDSPPTLDNMTGHAGQFPNCRCYPAPILPEI
jgi:SPP1 gp7 family putative phage head morphogenesis protein